MPRDVTALLLAGNRPGGDPLAQAFGVASKALVPLAGKAMVARVARVLLEHPRIARIVILAQADVPLADGDDTRWLAADPRIAFEHGGASVSMAVAAAIERHGARYPFLLTTADHALLTPAMLDALIAGAEARGADVAVGLVERRTLLAAYPGNRRTWLRFRGGAYSGANLFWIASPAALPALRLWRTIEQRRKRGRAVIAAFGPWILAGVALRFLGLEGALRRAGRRLGLAAAPVVLPQAEACIDVDSVADHALAETILAARS